MSASRQETWCTSATVRGGPSYRPNSRSSAGSSCSRSIVPAAGVSEAEPEDVGDAGPDVVGEAASEGDSSEGPLGLVEPLGVPAGVEAEALGVPLCPGSGSCSSKQPVRVSAPAQSRAAVASLRPRGVRAGPD